MDWWIEYRNLLLALWTGVMLALSFVGAEMKLNAASGALAVMFAMYAICATVDAVRRGW